MVKYAEFAGRSVSLVDVLDSLDELRDNNISYLVKPNKDATEDTLQMLVGVVQGIERSIAKLRHQFGATS